MPDDVTVDAKYAETLQKVQTIVCKYLEKKPEEVTKEARFNEDLGADSLRVYELLSALEDEFQIGIDDDANKIETVDDVVKYILARQ